MDRFCTTENGCILTPGSEPPDIQPLLQKKKTRNSTKVFFGNWISQFVKTILGVGEKFYFQRTSLDLKGTAMSRYLKNNLVTA